MASLLPRGNSGDEHGPEALSSGEEHGGVPPGLPRASRKFRDRQWTRGPEFRGSNIGRTYWIHVTTIGKSATLYPNSGEKQ